MNVRETVESFGIEVVEEREDEIIAPCPGHLKKTGSRDHNPSWSINTETGVHYCFSCHYKGNLYTLAVDMVGKDAARQYLAGSPVPREEPSGRLVFSQELPKLPKPRRPFPESEMALFTDAPQWAMDVRRVDRTALDFYGVRWDEDAEAWVLPLRDPRRGYLIGYQMKWQRERRMLNVPTGIDKSSTLFGIVENADAEEVVLVESPLDAVLLHTLDVPAVAICGSRLSRQQSDLLGRFSQVVLALDNDEAGRRETERIVGSEALWYMRKARYRGSGKDFGEMDVENILAAIGERVS